MKVSKIGGLESTALRSRFGRRLVLLFVGLALVPICTLALITYRSVSRELHAQSDERLKDETKAQTMAILERLALLEGELALLAAVVSVESPSPSLGALAAPMAERFRRLTWTDDARVTPLYGPALSRPDLSPDQWSHLRSGRALLVMEQRGGVLSRILMVRSFRLHTDASTGVLWSEVDPAYLWWGRFRESNLPPFTELCFVQTGSEGTLFCSAGRSADLSAEIRSEVSGKALGRISWVRAGEAHLAHFRTLVLSEKYQTPDLTIILSESEKRRGGPLREFRLSFLPILSVTLWIVLLLSVRQIRSKLVPLERLRAGTREIAARNFSTRVEVRSGDEFEELAGSFNTMAQRLGRQFDAMRALTEIQSAVLSARDRSGLADAVLTRLERLLPCARAQLTVLDPKAQRCGMSYFWPQAGEGTAEGEEVVLVAEDLWWLQETTEIRTIGQRDPLPAFLSGVQSDGRHSVVVIPVILAGAVIGVLAAGLRNRSALQEDDLGPAHQLADQLAQALSKAKVIEELEELSLGTLAALARTIDANSQWTLGHSERVTELATRLGRAVGLSKGDLDVLERGALLHDIGKIGVPPSVLDKPGRLTAEEMRQVQKHVEIGARILEPVPSLADTLPLVWQHHEWLDGSGYPRGLSGDDIHPLARLLSVVDCYDALRSERPYRGALEEDEVARHLRALAGRQFEPKFVEVFLHMLEEAEEDAVPPARRGSAHA